MSNKLQRIVDLANQGIEDNQKELAVLIAQVGFNTVATDISFHVVAKKLLQEETYHYGGVLGVVGHIFHFDMINIRDYLEKSHGFEVPGGHLAFEKIRFTLRNEDVEQQVITSVLEEFIRLLEHYQVKDREAIIRNTKKGLFNQIVVSCSYYDLHRIREDLKHTYPDEFGGI